MSENTKIEWANHTMNFWTGCEAISPACAHCYAATWAKRAGRDFAERQRTTPENWRKPLKWNAEAKKLGIRYRVFTNSLADFFDNRVPVEWREDALDLISRTPHLDWLVLTKRIGNARRMLNESVATISKKLNPERIFHRQDNWDDAPLANVWIGATVANQEEADRDIPKLLATPARIHFLSIEPMLGPVRLSITWLPVLIGDGPERTDGIDWVICGGESGGKSRPFDLSWARSIVEQCRAAGVACFVKQLGSAPHSPADRITHRGNPLPMPQGFSRYLNDRKGGDISEWPEDLRVRQFPEVA